MDSQNMTQEEMLQAQKDSCVFCKIIAGEIPSDKVYEDEHIVALLDINPASKGHVIVLPKEHFPILPLIPFSVMQHMFKKTHHIIGALKDAMIVSDVTVFIANGAAAGQQSPHFLYHLIPREDKDQLHMFTLPKTFNSDENELAVKGFSDRYEQLMKAYLQEVNREVVEVPSQSQVPVSDGAEDVSSQEPLDVLIQKIHDNDDLKMAIIERPGEVKSMIASDKKWAELFGSVDVDELSKNLRAMTAARFKEHHNTEKLVGTKANLDDVSTLFGVNK